MKILIFALSLFISTQAFAANADDILGVWWSPEQKTKVEITKEDNKYVGRIIAIRPEAKDKKIEGQSLLNYPILKNFEFKSDSWKEGTIFDPENGKTYKCVISLKNPNTLSVRGYVGMPLFGRTAKFEKVGGEKPKEQQDGEPKRYYGGDE